MSADLSVTFLDLLYTRTDLTSCLLYFMESKVQPHRHGLAARC